MTSEAALWKSISKITPNLSTDNAIEDCDDAIWACELIQRQDREDWSDDDMPLNSETAKRTKLNLKKQLDHTSDSKLDSMMDSAIADPSTWPDPSPDGSKLDDIDNHLSSIDEHLANIEALLRKRK